jgi:CotH kinase protein/Immunoglobulin domain/Secretion system C-terminal sorting domain
LDLPEESDWVLSANFTDKSFANNTLAYSLARKQGRYGPRTRFVEVMLDGAYQGIYVFTEKIKRDSLRLDIAKLRAIDTAGVELTGGYILKIDKFTGSASSPGWSSNYKVANCNASCNKYTKFQHEYPEEPVLHIKQRNYIRQYVDSFETALFSPNYTDPVLGYRKYITPSTFIDYMLINELSKNVDGYRISTYLYKPKASKLKMGPVWDYDIAFGNANYCQGRDTSGWAYNFNYVCPGDNFSVPAWWERFNADTNFKNQAKCMYNEYRQTIFSKSALNAYLDSVANVLKTASGSLTPIKRDSTKWNIIGNYVWPNPSPIPNSYNGEILETKNWLSQRINWMDANMPGTCIQPTVAVTVNNAMSKCVGDSLVLSVQATGPYPEYDWYKNGVKISGASSPTLKILSTTLSDSGVYTCRIKNLYNQEVLSSPMQVKIRTYPTITISGNNFVCPSNAVSLSASGANTYVWSTGQTTSTIAPIINGTTTISIQGTSFGCTSTASKTIQNFTLPNVSISSSAMQVCAGNSATLTAAGANSYVWSNSQAGTSIIVSPASATTYTTTGTDLNGCTNSANISIGILAQPIITIASNKVSLCLGDTAILSANGANTYAWNNGQTSANISASPTAPTVYSVVGTSALGCSASQNFTINPLALPNVSATSNLANTCSGTSILLSASGANTYLWNNGQVGSSISASPQITSNFRVVGTGANGCSNSFQLTHIVKPKPQITILVNDSVLCDGEQVTLTASGASTYTWSTGTNGPVVIVTPSQTINYTVNGVLNGCSGTSQKQIVVHPNPNVSFNLLDSIVCAGGSLILSGGAPSGGAYLGLNVQNGVFSSTNVTSGLYTIYYQYADAFGCGALKSDYVLVDACLSLKSIDQIQNSIRVFPNPFHQSIQVEHDFSSNLVLKVYNGLGQMIWTQNIENTEVKLSTNHLKTGQYYFVISKQDKIVYRQYFVKAF